MRCHAHDRVEARVLRSTSFGGRCWAAKAPDVPSVLIELGYVSNPEDEARLLDPAHRRALMGAIVRATDRYFAARKTSDPP